ncbi:polysialyltransferase family glycosyltransferase [Microbacterium dauci]|uniref:Polysialyltransferase family glycosyltransferase n=1 Tax=Microbacterium dauci TaxID=3048008 RepID=A0ABT6ZD59_9MICO|nr:polysialyltransferase family glycosyltransferase [Microbacterium sp. LX3-4]MDJ1114089.1 polysialyltransferase family glycosyltransferase [Microbacterium sp. LX3-4]
MTQVFAPHSTFGLMTVVAAIDAGVIPPTKGERILLAVNSAVVPEASTGIDEIPHLRGLLRRFDRVESLNELIAPTHPTQWAPSPEDLVVVERLLRRTWGLGAGPVQLYVQSPQVAPARTLAAMFGSAELGVIGDGLMTYAPMRVALPASMLSRMTSVIAADIVPGVAPLVLSERGVPFRAVPVEGMRAVLDEVEAEVVDARLARLTRTSPRTVLVLGQYLAALGLVSAAEEAAMQRDMVDAALAWSPERIVFKPHPSAPPVAADAVVARARELDLEVDVYSGDVPAELVARRLDPVGVVAGFSTALPTVHALAATPIAAVGTETLLARFRPYENSNRMAVTIVDAMTRADAATPMRDLVCAVGYAMQPEIMRHLRPRAVEVIGAMSAADRERYVGSRRLTELHLPGADGSLGARLRFAPASVSRLEQARLVARGARRRAGRAWKELKGR